MNDPVSPKKEPDLVWRSGFCLLAELLFEALFLRKDGLAQAQRLRRDFQEFVVADEFHALFEGEDGRRDEAERFVRTGGAGVRQVLRLADVADDVFRPAALADDHAFVHVDAGADEEGAAVLRVEESVRGGDAVLVDDDGAALAGLDVALIRRVAVEELVHDAVAVGVGHELGAVADEAAGGDAELEVGGAAVVGDHVPEFRFPCAEFLDDGADVVAGHFDG